MEQQPRIRTATPNDIEAMIVLLDILFSIETDFVFSPARARRGLELLLSRQDSARVVVADTGDRVVAMCTLQLLVSTAEGGIVGLIEDVVVDQDWRGKGTGRRLLQALEQWALAQGASRLQLLADDHNQPAQSFYAAMGWTPTQLRVLRRFPGKDQRTS